MSKEKQQAKYLVEAKGPEIVSTPADVLHYREAGADVVLIGEALVTNDPILTLGEFLAV